MRKYTFEVVIEGHPGSDEFWEQITDFGKKSGCDELLKEIQDSVEAPNWEVKVKLIKYEDNERN